MSSELTAAHGICAGDGSVFSRLALPPPPQVLATATTAITDHEFKSCSFALVEEEFRSISHNKSFQVNVLH